jgi:hypothetical protein
MFHQHLYSMRCRFLSAAVGDLATYRRWVPRVDNPSEYRICRIRSLETPSRSAISALAISGFSFLSRMALSRVSIIPKIIYAKALVKA